MNTIMTGRAAVAISMAIDERRRFVEIHLGKSTEFGLVRERLYWEEALAALDEAAQIVEALRAESKVPA